MLRYRVGRYLSHKMSISLRNGRALSIISALQSLSIYTLSILQLVVWVVFLEGLVLVLLKAGIHDYVPLRLEGGLCVLCLSVLI